MRRGKKRYTTQCLSHLFFELQRNWIQRGAATPAATSRRSPYRRARDGTTSASRNATGNNLAGQVILLKFNRPRLQTAPAPTAKRTGSLGKIIDTRGYAS